MQAKNTFKVTVDGSFEFDLTEGELQGLDIVEKNSSNAHFIHDDASLDIDIIESDFHKKAYKIKIGANTYEVEILDELALLIKEMGLSVGSAKQVNSVKAPMPGLVIDIHVAPGTEIKENDSLIVVEAMKMENILTAPRDGVIKSISVQKGDTVDKGALLIELE